MRGRERKERRKRDEGKDLILFITIQVVVVDSVKSRKKCRCQEKDCFRSRRVQVTFRSRKGTKNHSNVYFPHHSFFLLLAHLGHGFEHGRKRRKREEDDGGEMKREGIHRQLSLS